MPVRIDTSGLRAKLRNLKRFRDSLTFVHQDGAAWFKGKLINEVINGQFVGVITGNLRRSHVVRPFSKDKTLILVPQSAPAAPYAPLVARRVRNKFGQDYIELTRFFFEEDLIKIATDQISRMIKAVNQRRRVVYTNPYPAT